MEGGQEELIPVHVGLFGHVDHGKTELARALSEKISTAGLDAHPEAKRRQMTIDIGFTAFVVGDYLVTLVDVPGHADLIRTAVSGASIIDAAILAVSATQGPQIQTGEHLVLLESLGVEKVIVALTYADAVKEDKLVSVKESIRKVLSDSRYVDAPIVAVSSITGFGLPEFKTALLSLLSPPKRELEGKLKMVIDHSFPIKGAGTVVTGTILRGRVAVGDSIELSPLNRICRVKSIQTFKESRSNAEAGDRAGIALQGIDHRSISRGFYVSSPGSLKTTIHITSENRISRFFKREITPGLPMHVTIGMSSVQAKIFPYSIDEHHEKVVTSVFGEKEFESYIRLSRPVVAEKGDRLLLSLLTLPPTSLRIAAGGSVSEILLGPPPLRALAEKSGFVSRITQNGRVILGGLAKGKNGAENIIGEVVTTENNSKGIISSTFGTKGSVIADFEVPPRQGEKVSVRKYRVFNIT
jgi:selenocysteine-specific elongation factor